LETMNNGAPTTGIERLSRSKAGRATISLLGIPISERDRA
jgi:hypothetical protein